MAELEEFKIWAPKLGWTVSLASALGADSGATSLVLAVEGWAVDVVPVLAGEACVVAPAPGAPEANWLIIKNSEPLTTSLRPILKYEGSSWGKGGGVVCVAICGEKLNLGAAATKEDAKVIQCKVCSSVVTFGGLFNQYFVSFDWLQWALLRHLLTIRPHKMIRTRACKAIVIKAGDMEARTVEIQWCWYHSLQYVQSSMQDFWSYYGHYFQCTRWESQLFSSPRSSGKWSRS